MANGNLVRVDIRGDETYIRMTHKEAADFWAERPDLKPEVLEKARAKAEAEAAKEAEAEARAKAQVEAEALAAANPMGALLAALSKATPEQKAALRAILDDSPPATEEAGGGKAGDSAPAKK